MVVTKGMCPKNNLPTQLALKLKWHKGLKQNVAIMGGRQAGQGKWNVQMENAFGILYPGFVAFIDFFLFSISIYSFVSLLSSHFICRYDTLILKP